MDTITSNVDDLTAPDRLALEHVLGRALSTDQQVVIAVLPKGNDSLLKTAARARLLKTLQQTADHAATIRISAGIADSAVDEAMQAVRPRVTKP